MARTSTYLNFERQTEEAFLFYKSVFGGEFSAGGILRYGSVPRPEGVPSLPLEDQNLVMHIELPITGGHILMGTDTPKFTGHTVKFGNNISINLEPDTREEARRLFDGLAKGGQVTMELQEVFWDAYFGSLVDKFGVNWLINCPNKPR